MDKTITISGQLEQFNQELQLIQREEKKDRYVLLCLAIAGILGVYSLVNLGTSNTVLVPASDTTEVEGAQKEAPKNSPALLDL